MLKVFYLGLCCVFRKNEDEVDVDVITASLNKTFFDFDEEIKYVFSTAFSCICLNYRQNYIVTVLLRWFLAPLFFVSHCVSLIH